MAASLVAGGLGCRMAVAAAVVIFEDARPPHRPGASGASTARALRRGAGLAFCPSERNGRR